MQADDQTLSYTLDELERISSDPAVIAEYISRKKFEMDQDARMARARREGIRETALKYLNKVLNKKFGSSALAVQAKVRAITDAAVLDEIMDAALAADSIEELGEAIDRICRRTQK